ncbi:pancreatic lipase-related protein 2 isoform X2 [Bombyx mori]|nr:pancreatic lipase-related protein 2 isoform X2 [Bombyx mori]
MIANALPYENEYGPEYGEEWIMFLDDNGNTHTLNFSVMPVDSRGLLFGKVYFHLYTRRNNVSELLLLPENNEQIRSEYFDATKSLTLLTHGWLSSSDSEWLQYIKNSLLKRDDFNVIAVDWREISRNKIYPWPAFSTRYVGKQIAKLLQALRNSYRVDSKSIHLIGHSLGAHVMGYAGMFHEGNISRITGLDPALPLFEIPQLGPDFRLEKSDADFVDIIHTCGGIYGYRRSHGHADFYPNDGRPKQPGCDGIQPIIEGCSHGRSTEFYGESITSKISFNAYPCDSWRNYEKGECKEDPTLMGHDASAARHGDFYLYTNDEKPYAKAEK